MNADDSGPQNQPADDEIDTTPTAAPMEARSPLLDGIACAADVSSTSEEPVIRLSCHELPDRPWYGRFQPRPPCHIGAVETNPTLPTIELPHGSDGCSVYVRYLDSYTTLASNLLWIDELVEWYGLREDSKTAAAGHSLWCASSDGHKTDPLSDPGRLAQEIPRR
jgi:hypothetical protein